MRPWLCSSCLLLISASNQKDSLSPLLRLVLVFMSCENKGSELRNVEVKKINYLGPHKKIKPV